ncbi:MAG: GNAT family N-acetyltransferase [Gemmataceae bacterium]
MRTATINCREVLRATDPVLNRVRDIYETSFHSSERIPWDWLTWSLTAAWPHGRKTHMLTARRTTASGRTQTLGFIVASFLPRLGGYISYVAVDPRARGRGVGAFLYKSAIRRLRRTAHESGLRMPCLIWDSRPPSPSDPVEVRENWESRLHLFKKIGGQWIEGVQFTSPNFLNPRAGDVPLEFFLKPVEASAERFSDARIRRVIHGLLSRVYRLDPEGRDRDLLREYALLRLAPIA